MPYRSLEALVARIDSPAREACQLMIADHRGLFSVAPGASKNHQDWVGGYWDHVSEVMNLGVVLWTVLNFLRPLAFSLSDVLLVLFLHDLEKPWRYVPIEGGGWKVNPALKDKAARQAFREAKLAKYGLVLTEAQENALRYVEGEGNDYCGDGRVMNDLAAVCHCCDVLSARLWPTHPVTGADPWGDPRRSK
jgi:hypothetical protein